ncbi:MAG: hypothetical protein WCG23_07240 [bacterium]
MLKNCRILNKNTNELFFGQIDTEFENLSEYELAEIPDDQKLYKFENGQIVEYAENQTENHNSLIIQQIHQIEASQSRASREAILYGDKTRLEQYEQQIINLRNQITN